MYTIVIYLYERIMDVSNCTLEIIKIARHLLLTRESLSKLPIRNANYVVRALVLRQFSFNICSSIVLSANNGRHPSVRFSVCFRRPRNYRRSLVYLYARRRHSNAVTILNVCAPTWTGWTAWMVGRLVYIAKRSNGLSALDTITSSTVFGHVSRYRTSVQTKMATVGPRLKITK